MNPHPLDPILFLALGAALTIATRYLYRVNQNERREQSKRNHPTHKPERINK